MPAINQIGALPAPSKAPPALQSGTVVLYHDDNWDSQSYTLDTNNFRENQRQSITGTNMQDQATWIAFNLPVGTVMTLTDNVAELEGYPVWNLRNCGRVVDLVGTGTTVGVDLMRCNMNDCISSFFWRRIPFNIGAIELFEDVDFGGNRTILFLDDWPFGTVNSIEGWYIDDRVSSARWTSLDDVVAAMLFDNIDGSGSSFNNIMGWGGDKQLKNFFNISFNDCMSSFRWDGLVPKQEVITPLRVPINVSQEDSFNLTSQVNGTNASSLDLPVTIGLTNAHAQTVTVTITDTATTGFKVTSTVDYRVGTDLAGAGGSLSIELSFSYEQSKEVSNSMTQTVELSITEEPTVPANSSYTCTLIAQIGKLPPTTFTTPATRWYDQPVAGSVMDPSNGWYQRVETVTMTVAGGLACGVNVNVSSTPLGSASTAEIAA